MKKNLCVTQHNNDRIATCIWIKYKLAKNEKFCNAYERNVNVLSGYQSIFLLIPKNTRKFKVLFLK